MNRCFITAEPLHDGLNWYAYANNNPLRFVDPTGLLDIDSAGNLIAEAGGSDPNIGSTTGLMTVTAEGAGAGYDFSIKGFNDDGVVFSKERVGVDFNVEETGDSFSADYTSTVTERSGINISSGAYTVFLEGRAQYPVGTPFEEIADDFGGDAKGYSGNVSIGFASMSGGLYNSGKWNYGVATFGGGVGVPAAAQVEKTFTDIVPGSFHMNDSTVIKDVQPSRIIEGRPFPSYDRILENKK